MTAPVFTFGLAASYDKALADAAVHGNPVHKLGPREPGVLDSTGLPYLGGIAFPSAEAAWQSIRDGGDEAAGYGVYRLDGNFARDTRWVPDEDRYAITRDLVILGPAAVTPPAPVPEAAGTTDGTAAAPCR